MAREGRPPAELLATAEFAISLWWAIGQDRGALGIARDLTERAPFHARAWVLRGRAQLEADELDRARSSVAKAIERDDTMAEAHALLGDCLKAAGDQQAAAKAYQTALERAEDGDEARRYEKALRRLAGGHAGRRR
jgi:tetratricopeptide (TPR) repeat protein